VENTKKVLETFPYLHVLTLKNLCLPNRF